MANKPNKPQALTVSAVGTWKVIGTDDQGKKVYGAKIWEPQTVAEGDLVSLKNWKDQVSIVRVVGEGLESVGADFHKGQMGYTVYAVEPVAK